MHIIDIIEHTIFRTPMLQCAFNPIGLHYISRDQHEAHELTNHILHPSPEPSRRSPGAPGKRLRMLCGMFRCHRQERVWRWMDCSKPVVHHCTLYDQAPNSHKEQNDPCDEACVGPPSGWFLVFQCLEESSYLNNNTYNQYKPYNRKGIKRLV